MENNIKERTLDEKIKMFPVYVMSRVTGWFVDKSAMNFGKKAEFNDRVYYKIK